MSPPRPRPQRISTSTNLNQSEEELAPPTSASSDASEESWGKVSQVLRGVKRDPTYYIDSGDVVFLIESRLFKVHRYFFVRESEKFKDLLRAAVVPGAAMMGSFDGWPVELREVSAEEFSRFLWVFYNPDYSYEASIAEWSSILRLAHMWKFPKVKELAVREMDKLDIPPVDKAVMAREFVVDPARRWLETAYAELGAREQPLTKEEGLRLGLDVVLHLAEVRERIRTRRRLAAEAMSAPPTPPHSFFQHIGKDIPLPPNGREPQYYESDESEECRPPSVGSERSYNPQMAESIYIPRHGDSPMPCNSRFSRNGSLLSPRSLTTPPPMSCQKSYTEDDVADVKSVFG